MISLPFLGCYCFLVVDLTARFRWFYGDLSANEAGAMVTRGNASGSYLMRFSGSEMGGYAFTTLTRDNQATHFRVKHERGTYVLQSTGKGERRFGSLKEALTWLTAKLEMIQPCQGSPLGVALQREEGAYIAAYGRAL